MARTVARWLGACALFIAAQSCVGPDLEPPTPSTSSGPGDLPAMTPMDAGAGPASKPSEPTLQPGQPPPTGAAAAGRSAPMMTGPTPNTNAGAAAEAAEDAGVPDAGTIRR